MQAFKTIHPAVAMFYFVSVISVGVFTRHPIILGQALLGAICFVTILERGKDFFRNLSFYIPLFIIIALINPLFSHNGTTPLFFMNGKAITKEAILLGVAIATMIIGVMIWFKSYSIIMTSDKFLFLFGKITPKLSLVISGALRFIPLFKTQIKRVNNTQKTMGLYTSKSVVDRIRSSIRVFSIMVSWSIENTIETGNSMRARGYGLKGRTHYSLFRWSSRDTVLFFIFAGLVITVLIGWAFGGISFYFYPRITDILTLPASISTYICFGILAFLPFIMELEENLKWNYSVSKI